jgi:ABC-2 type transport system permease protein
VFMFNGFLIASIALRFVFPAVSLESDSFWCVRSSPLSLKKLYWYKFLVSFVPLFIVAEVLAVASTMLFRVDVPLLQVASICGAFLALSLTGLNLGVGTYFALFNERNPIRVASSQGASLTFLASMVYLASVVLILIVPLNRYFEGLVLHGTFTGTWTLVPISAIAALSVITFTSSSILGIKAIKRDL